MKTASERLQMAQKKLEELSLWHSLFHTAKYRKAIDELTEAAGDYVAFYHLQNLFPVDPRATSLPSMMPK